MSSPIARCPRCGHHSRFEGRPGSVVRCSCGADLVLSEAGLPPLGTRFGDLSPEQRAALPVGTVLLAFDGIPELTRTDWGGWTDEHWVIYNAPSPHQLLVYPDPIPEPDPRDSDGPGSDEGGGEMRTGDDDHDGDVPEVAALTVWGMTFRFALTCQGAEDAPRDCLEAP